MTHSVNMPSFRATMNSASFRVKVISALGSVKLPLLASRFMTPMATAATVLNGPGSTCVTVLVFSMMTTALLTVCEVVSSIVFMTFGSVVGSMIRWTALEGADFSVRSLLCRDRGIVPTTLLDSESMNGTSTTFTISFVATIDEVSPFSFSGTVS